MNGPPRHALRNSFSSPDGSELPVVDGSATRTHWGFMGWNQARRRAFSLVEVALALGIVSFGLVALMGVVPVAMDRYRDATDFSVTADVMRSLVGELEWAYGEDEPPNLSSRYFTEEGIETRNIDEGLYEATMVEQSPGSVKIFGSSLDDLKAIKVQIFRLPVGNTQGARPLAFHTIFVTS